MYPEFVPVIAIIGASNDRRKFGNKALRAFRRQGYTVVPVNPHEKTVEGETAYRSVLDYPGAIDEASMYVHPEAGLTVIDDLAEKKIPAVWLNPGAESPEVIRRAEALGVRPIVACSILGVGEDPMDF
jgi:predicted CoA-binding protein